MSFALGLQELYNNHDNDNVIITVTVLIDFRNENLVKTSNACCQVTDETQRIATVFL